MVKKYLDANRCLQEIARQKDGNSKHETRFSPGFSKHDKLTTTLASNNLMPVIKSFHNQKTGNNLERYPGPLNAIDNFKLITSNPKLIHKGEGHLSEKCLNCFDKALEKTVKKVNKNEESNLKQESKDFEDFKSDDSEVEENPEKPKSNAYDNVDKDTYDLSGSAGDWLKDTAVQLTGDASEITDASVEFSTNSFNRLENDNRAAFKESENHLLEEKPREFPAKLNQAEKSQAEASRVNPDLKKAFLNIQTFPNKASSMLERRRLENRLPRIKQAADFHINPIKNSEVKAEESFRSDLKKESASKIAENPNLKTGVRSRKIAENTKPSPKKLYHLMSQRHFGTGQSRNMQKNDFYTEFMKNTALKVGKESPKKRNQ